MIDAHFAPHVEHGKTAIGCCKGPDCTHWDEIAPETSEEAKSTEEKPIAAEQQQQQQQ
ncbi:hypothetical protein [Rubinisphaera brasiliensis]|uniref:hypothetical protein n=1 Tax=Rubinisphaera brasiliensis TaxID=119 RepID=UPI000310F39E|nr:hypothetical protein [Rubinisphaera brasiliensis]